MRGPQRLVPAAARQAGAASPQATSPSHDPSPRSRPGSRWHERQACLRHWAALEGSWRRLPGAHARLGARAGAAACVGGADHDWARAVQIKRSRGQEARLKHTSMGPNMPIQERGPGMNTARSADEHDVSVADVASSARQGLGPVVHFIEKASMQEIMVFVTSEGERQFDPAIVAALLHRIAVLHPPMQSPKLGDGSKDAGSLVRAVLGHIHQHLSTTDAILLADIVSSIAMCVHLQGMRFWFSNGGAGGLGAKLLLTLVAKAADLPPERLASVIGALGRLGTGEQGLAAMGHGLGQHALEAIPLWDSSMLLEAMDGLMLLQRAKPSPVAMAAAGCGGGRGWVKGQRGAAALAPDRGMVARVMEAILHECEGKLKHMTLEQLLAVMAGASGSTRARGRALSPVLQVSS